MTKWQATIIAGLAGLALLGVIAYGYNSPAVTRPLSARPATISVLLAAQAQAASRDQLAYLLPLSEPNLLPLRLPGSSDFIPTAKAVLLYDSGSQRLLFNYHGRQPLPVASLTKLLTALVVVDELALQTVLTAQSAYLNRDGTGADFRSGERLTVADLLKALLVKSSNDAAYILAAAMEEKTGQTFPVLMQSKATSLNLLSSHWLDAAGLNDDAYATAEDLLLLERAVSRSPLLKAILAMPQVDLIAVNGRAYHFNSTDQLLSNLAGVVLGKTGFTDGAGGCMILEVKLPQSDSTLVAIVLGATDRFAETKRLIEWAEQSFRWQ